MNNRPAAPARFGATAFVVTSCLLIASVTYAAASPNGSYSGRTSQRHAISFRIGAGAVRRLRYRIDDRCPGGRRLVVRAWGFPALKIAHHHFGGTFVAKAPSSAKAVIAGRVSGATVPGTLSDRTLNRTTHRFCTGKATFSLRRRAAVRPPDASLTGAGVRSLRQLVLGNTMLLANERPVGPKKHQQTS